MRKLNAQQNTTGVLLAAGRGRRMGTLKQLLPLGDSTVVASTFDGLSPFCDEGMIVVLGAEAEDVDHALGDARLCTVVLSDPDAEQIESVALGLREAMRSTNGQYFLVHPADHPFIPAAVVEGILIESERTDKVVIPTIEGRGGHPIVIPRLVAASILAWFDDQRSCAQTVSDGLRAFWALHPELLVRVSFDPEEFQAIRIDLDTREDYERARTEFGSAQLRAKANV